MNLTKSHLAKVSQIVSEKNIAAALFFGQNNGLVLELSAEAFKSFKYDLKKVFTEEDILKNPNILMDAVQFDDFFSEKTLIKIFNVTTKFYQIFEKILPAIREKKDKIRLCLIGEDIAAKTKLRNLFENEDDLISACCYFDEKQDALSYISTFAKENKINFTAEAADFMAENLHGDRRILKNELQTINLTFFNEKERELSLEDIKPSIENQTMESIFDFIDYFAVKNKQESLKIIEKIFLSEEFSLIAIVHLLSRHFLNIIAVKDRVDKKLTTIDAESVYIFFKRKLFFRRQLEIWTVSDLNSLLNFISSLETAAIRFGENLAKQMLINKILKY